jgi:hypothetical protein
MIRTAIVALVIASGASGGSKDPPLRHAQDPEAERVMAAVRAAVTPALPYPDSDGFGSLPKDEKSTAVWMVRPHAPGDESIEVLANPLNLANQQRATKAMAQIQSSVESAQRRSEAQYERAISEAKRTGKSQEVDGVTLSDEGVAGARVDAESHVLIEVEFNRPSYRFSIPSSIEPAPARLLEIPGAVSVMTIPSNVYREKTARSVEDRFCPAETIVFFGELSPAGVDKRSDTSYDVGAAATSAASSRHVRSLVLRLRGNDTLIAQILRASDWNPLLELLK